MYRFSYFTQKANDVINLAIKAAENFGHNYIGSEHILLGILQEGTGLGAEVLNNKGVSAEDIQRLIEENIGRGNPTRLTPDDFTPRCKRILEVAFQLARGMMNSFVGTEHLLMAVLKESDSYAVKFLMSLGVSPESVIEDVFSSVGRNEVGASGRARAKLQPLTSLAKTLLSWQDREKLTLLSAEKKRLSVLSRYFQDVLRITRVLSVNPA